MAAKHNHQLISAMAKFTSSTQTLLALAALILSLFLAQGEAQGATLKCFIPYGVQGEDTCFAVENKFKIGSNFFALINPNLNCSALFVGQWLCVDGTVS